MSGMQEIIERILAGNFDYENGSLDFSCTKIELTLPRGNVYEGSFHISSTQGRLAEGCVETADLRMECLTCRFSGTDAEIAYRFHGEHMEEGDVVKGVFSVISNHGEYYLPYVVSIEHSVLQSSIGPVKNLFHFANLAKTNWREALLLYYSPEFPKAFSGADGGYMECYRGLSVYPGNEQHMEEFLIYINKKQRVEYTAEESELLLKLPCDADAVTECGLTIVRNGWGYTFLRVECEGDFLRAEKEVLTDDFFLGNSYRLPLLVDAALCRRGRNFGRVRLSNPYLSLTVPVEVRVGEENARGQTLLRKRTIARLMQLYQDFRLRKISASVWRGETGKLVERMVAWDEDAVDARLFQAQLLITEGRLNEARWVMGHLAELLEAGGERENAPYAYYLYLTTLLDPKEENVREAAALVEQIYRKNRGEWRTAWLLLYLSEEYNATAAGKWMFLEKQFEYGCTSPILYLEALILLNGNPHLMRRLGNFELQVLGYGGRRDALLEDTVEQLLYLCGRRREFSQVLLRVLESVYSHTQDVRALQEICALLIKGNKAGVKYLEWYQRGVEAQLRITNLYEYYMLSVDRRRMRPIPRTVMMYFSYQNNLDYERSAYLYHYLIQTRRDFIELYDSYGMRMEQFVYEQIGKEHINRNLAALYQMMLTPNMINEQTAPPLSKLLFANWIQVENRRIRKVLIYQPGNRNPVEYTLQDGASWAAIYGNDYTVVFEDGEGNRFVKSVEYTLEKLMLPGRYLRTVAQYVMDSEAFNLYLCENARGKGQLDADTAGRCSLLIENPNVEGALRGELAVKLLQYYYDTDDMRSLDDFLERLPLEDLNLEERGIAVKYLARRGKREAALGQIREYGPYFVDPKVLALLLDEVIHEGEIVEDEVLLAGAYHVFRSGKYGPGALSYLVAYFQGMSRELRDVWKAASDFNLDCGLLCERMLVQMLYSGAFVGEKLEIFRDYASGLTDPRVEEAFLAQCSYEYFVREKVTDHYLFCRMQEKYERGQGLPRVCRLAYLKYYAENPEELTREQAVWALAFLRELADEKVHLGFFRAYLEDRRGWKAQLAQEAGEILREMEDKTIVEYRSHPGGRARIHYVIVQEDGSSGEYRSEYMWEVFGGVCFKEFVLFFGENLQYYIVEETEAGEQLTESGNLQRGDAPGERADSRFELINDIVISKTMQDYDTLDGLLQEYYRREYMNGALFELL